MSRTRKAIGLTALVISVAATFMLLARTSPVEQQTTTTTLPPPVVVATPVPKLPTAPPSEPLSVRVEQLTKSNNPADKFVAYRLVFQCTMFSSQQRPEARKAWDAQDCGTLQEWHRRDSLNNLRIAAKAAVPDAGVAFYDAGPFGDGDKTARPDDPLVAQWKRDAFDYVQRDALKGDLTALSKLSDMYRAGDVTKQDRKMALATNIALFQAREAQTAQQSPYKEKEFIQLSYGLPSADVANAKAIAADLINKCCSSSAIPPR